jgi:pantetheine-phosphate adenylyltransferase
MHKIALYPGTFDPITYGHLDIIKRGLEIFDHVIVGVAHNTRKSPLFTVEERVDILRKVTNEFEHLEVAQLEGLMIDYARQRGADVIIRGLRAVSDFEYELQMALTNRKLASDIETVFLMPSAQYSFLNSSLVKEISRLGGRVACFVPPPVEARLTEKYRELTAQ